MEKNKILTVDCRSEEGITIGLIDSLISISRVLAKRDLKATNQIKEAMKDLRNDEDLESIIMEKTNEHSAKKLKAGDTFIATIRHKTDGTKNLINQKCTVVHNGEIGNSLIAKTDHGIVRIPYNEITEIINVKS